MIFKGEMKNKLQKVCKSWEGAPYKHMGASRGGVDCTKLVALILLDLELLYKIESTYYAGDWSENSTKEVLLTAFYRHLVLYIHKGYTCDIWRYKKGMELHEGDIFVFNNGKGGSCMHTAIYVDGRMLHASVGGKVSYTWFSEFWVSKCMYIFRLDTKK